ncbi:DUF1207 domain-containing protein [Exiguobacterium sp. N5]|uniref:DUF1207 domain-containing protein n=1 Tax=Exiguobacterium sp. N5 TaxID=2990450 RepID=UPI0021F4933C|nr:DUF1207 domain-containing protein [Exiguobacterium sp. N5]MCV9899781.1 DUF1207 domain-containing protein [Exiguobacterium sp. N5]
MEKLIVDTTPSSVLKKINAQHCQINYDFAMTLKGITAVDVTFWEGTDRFVDKSYRAGAEFDHCSLLKH